jgi:hypothetical protein
MMKAGRHTAAARKRAPFFGFFLWGVLDCGSLVDGGASTRTSLDGGPER